MSGGFNERWTKSHFKEGGSPKVARFKQRLARKSKEDEQKAAVRKRDKWCRFPLCGCRKYHLALHVSHQQHKGMGGNPNGERSTTSGMMYVCSARHRENRFAIDRGTVRWRALTKDGADGPVAWDVASGKTWKEVARERAVNHLEPLTEAQRAILLELAEMTT